jgi:hypothetical protein
MNHCLRHFEEPVAARCRDCGHPFCGRCLVYAFGPKKPPYCVGCALHASGIRAGTRVVDVEPEYVPSDAGAPEAPMDKRTERALRRAEKAALKQQAKATKQAAKQAAKHGGEQVPDHGPQGAETPLAPLPGPAATHEAARTAQVPAPSQLLAGAHAGAGEF